MLVALGAALAAVLLFFVVRSRKGAAAEPDRESTVALDAWIADTLEVELAEGVLGMRGASEDERKKLRSSLHGDADPDVVGKIEDKVRAVELEYVRYAHETDAEVTLRVRYEDGNTAAASKRLPWTDVPEGVRSDIERRGATRAFRSWVFPWSRVAAL